MAHSEVVSIVFEAEDVSINAQAMISINDAVIDAARKALMIRKEFTSLVIKCNETLSEDKDIALRRHYLSQKVKTVSEREIALGGIKVEFTITVKITPTVSTTAGTNEKPFPCPKSPFEDTHSPIDPFVAARLCELEIQSCVHDTEHAIATLLFTKYM